MFLFSNKKILEIVLTKQTKRGIIGITGGYNMDTELMIKILELEYYISSFFKSQ